MKEITIESVSEFLNNKKLALHPTQSKICIPIINRLYQKMISNLKFGEIKVCDNLIIDGHHRYIASLLADKLVGNVPAEKNTSTTMLMWRDVELSEIDWDSPEVIQRCNKEDARYNNISIEEIIKITK